MSRPSDRRPPDADVAAFLECHHGAPASRLEPLYGGYWSAAYAYRLGEDEFVLRIGDDPEGFRSDRDAMRFGSAALPIPEVLAIGEGFGRWVAISRRHHGRFLEDVDPAESEAAGPALVGLLSALRTTPDAGPPVVAWRDWLLAGLTDVPGTHTAGWRGRLDADPTAVATFRAAEQRIRGLLDACPDRRELVHADLLHRNVLLAESGDRVTAVFSWKCSTWGDSVYDLAWCTFWSRWHPGIAAIDPWARVLASLPDPALVDIGVRHHAYELQIGASHLGWYATLGDADNLARTVRALDELLGAGPRH